jgi:hypothetical protein
MSDVLDVRYSNAIRSSTRQFFSLLLLSLSSLLLSFTGPMAFYQDMHGVLKCTNLKICSYIIALWENDTIMENRRNKL